tara:strand:- start:202 stop:915 length:714 start_codon:yes stop_codon:yes gene_type:complete
MDYTPNYSEYGTCARCDAGIKYIYHFDGKTYGSTCIERMLGIKVERFNTTDVNAIVKQIEEDKRTAEQIIEDEQKLYKPIAKKVFSSNHIGDISDKIELDVTITEHFWFEGLYGSSCCVKMIDDDNNQIVVFTTAKWVDTIENGDKVTITGIVKNHNKIGYTKAYTTNPENYHIEKVSKSGNKYYEIDYDKAVKDGHSLGFSFPYHIEEEMNIEKVRGIYEINQTQLTRVKLLKEVA